MKRIVFLIFSIILLVGNITVKSQNESTMDKIKMISGDGLTGHYYESFLVDSLGIITFTDLVESFTRIDTVIDFWDGSQYYRWQAVPGWTDYYSVHWEGYIYIEQTGQYGFGIISDDGSQIWIDDVLIMDNADNQWYDWEDNISEGDTSGTPFPPLLLDSGFHKIDVTFYEHVSYEGIELWWLKPGADSSDIPYYGTHFHDIYPTYNPNTNWEIVPKSVLFTETDTTTSIEKSDEEQSLPSTPKLYQNYPNPFNPGTVISWQLAVGSDIELTIYNLLGKKVATLISKQMNPGNHSYHFNGEHLASGVYVYVLTAGTTRTMKKMILLR